MESGSSHRGGVGSGAIEVPRCSSCSSQRCNPGRKGTSFATAKVLMLQETVMITTWEAVS